MVDFRACPRCQGDVQTRQDMYGEYKQCLQCGYSRDIQRLSKRTFNLAVSRGKAGRPRKASRKKKAA